MNLTLLKAELTVCQLDAGAAIPAWTETEGEFVSVTRTREELSIICSARLPPADTKQEAGWCAFKVEGPLAFGLVGILAAIANPLAKAGISIFATSTYHTDYVLVKEAKVPEAIAALEAAGHTINRE
jgi:hypothetical protein